MNNEVYKVVFLGDSGVGKTFIVLKWRRLLHNSSIIEVPTFPKWMKFSSPTMGSDVHPIHTKYKGNKVTLKVWDIAGKEELSGDRNLYIKNCDICVIIYNSDKSYSNIEKWRKIITKGQPSVPIILYKNVDEDSTILEKMILDKLNQ